MSCLRGCPWRVLAGDLSLALAEIDQTARDCLKHDGDPVRTLEGIRSVALAALNDDEIVSDVLTRADGEVGP